MVKQTARPGLPELQDAKKVRFMSAYGLSADDAGVLVAEQETALFFERVAAGRDPRAAANWVMGDLFGALNRLGFGIEDLAGFGRPARGIDRPDRRRHDLRPARQGGLCRNGRHRGRCRDDRRGKSLRQVTDSGAIEAVIGAVLAAHADKVAEYRAGRDKLYGFFVGQVMRATQGKANPALVNELLQKKLAG